MSERCRFGYVEYDGFAFCYEHLGWRHYVEMTMRCDRARITSPAKSVPSDGVS